MLSKSLATLIALPCAAMASATGSSGKLSSLDGGLEGTVTVVDDTTVMIENYQLEDASAPALYWWGATDDDLSGGFRISNEQVSEESSSDSITIDLDADYTAADFSVVGLWCERLNANFGQATLSGEGSSGSTDEDSDDKEKEDDDNGAAGLMTSGNSASFAALLTLASVMLCLA